jgi:hypothetical protein
MREAVCSSSAIMPFKLCLYFPNILFPFPNINMCTFVDFLENLMGWITLLAERR